ncbi:hypothetical protein AWM66_00135 [Riemerella anatipestifer]|uniref:hypothetical protein n=1 Tax=Riemerella anatipestifer TaxID=34085 RepID=UPI0007EC5650|nr:hypothetical protein [Riemerella anatipestifer]OBP53971.1 hypothetical protein AWM66_00135 [Riemerella anatipestifer]
MNKNRIIEVKYFRPPFLIWWLFLSVQMFSQIHVQGGATVIDYTNKKNNDTEVKIIENTSQKSIKQKFSKKTLNNREDKTVSKRNAKGNNIRSNIVKNYFESKETTNNYYFSTNSVNSKKGIFSGSSSFFADLQSIITFNRVDIYAIIFFVLLFFFIKNKFNFYIWSRPPPIVFC